MAIDFSADIGASIKQLLTKGGGGKQASGGSPYIKLVSVAAGLVFVILLYVFWIYLPHREELQVKLANIEQIDDLRNQIRLVESNIVTAAQDLEFARRRYEELAKLFHTDQELEDLYGHISSLSLRHQLLLATLEKEDEEPIFEVPASDDENGEVAMEDSNTVQREIAYYRLKVKLEIRGNYARYTMFRRDLAKLNKVVNIDREEINVIEAEDARGDVQVIAQLSTYRMPSAEDNRAVEANEIML